MSRSIAVLPFAIVIALFLIIPNWTSGQSGVMTTVSAASFLPPLAPDAIASAFGSRLATATESAGAQPLPKTLAGTTVRVNGEAAALLFVSPTQINFLIPAGTPAGTAAVEVTAGDGTVSRGTARIAQAAPALFAANGNGQGPLGSLLLRVKSNGQFLYEPLSQYSQTERKFITRAFDFGEPSDRLYLVLYLTGARNAPSGSLSVNLGGVESPIDAVAPVAGLAGLDQINVALPCGFKGRGRISLSVKAAGQGSSNSGEFEIGSGASSCRNEAPMTITEVPTSPVLAGAEIEIGGSGFAANPRENEVRIVAEDGVTSRAEVLTVTGSKLRARVAFGSGTGQIKVTRGQNEASAAIQVRTSISGFIEEARQQDDGSIIRVPLVGARVRLLSNLAGERTVNADGSFVLPDPTEGFDILEVIPPPGTLNYPNLKYRMEVKPRRDNQLPRAPELAQSGSTQFPLLENAKAPDAQLTYLLPGRTPANLPVGHFSTRIAQITPFGVAITPAARLSFPNADAIPARAKARLFKFDQRISSATLGTFIDVGEATVSDDGQRVETAANAIDEGSYYFVSILRPRSTIIGRVIESDGRPVPRAIVQARGQSTFTDGHGGFVLRDVPVMKPSDDRIRVEVSYQRPDGSVSRKTSSEVELIADALVTIGAGIALDPVTANFPAVILAPSNLTLIAGETREFDFVAYDPDGAKPAQITPSGTATQFTMLTNPSPGVFRLRLSPSANAAGNYLLNLAAKDGAGAESAQSIAITVNPSSGAAPIAHPQSIAALEDEPRPITLAGSDAGGRPLSFMVMSQTARGSLSGTAPNLVYTPSSNYNGIDSFTFKASNGVAESGEATVFIAVAPVNDAPAIAIAGPLAVNAGDTAEWLVTASDVDGDRGLRIANAGLPPGASVVDLSGTTRQVRWTPAVAQAGVYAVTFTVTDQGNLSATKSVSITASAKWAQTSGPEGGDLFAFLEAGGALYAASHGGGVYRSLDDGRTWVEVNNGLVDQSLYVRDLKAIGATLYAGTAGGVFASGDNGQTWIAASNGLSGAALDIFALAVIGNDLYAGTREGAYWRPNNPRSWIAINAGLPDKTHIKAFAMLGTSLCAGTYGSGVYCTNDRGQNWTPVRDGLGEFGIYINSLAARNATLYAGTQSAGVFCLTGNPPRWAPVNDGLPKTDLRIDALLANGATLYAGSFGSGVYRLNEAGTSWSAVSGGLSGSAVYVNRLYASGARLYAGTLGGVYRLSSGDGGGQQWNRTMAGFLASSVRTLLGHGSDLLAGTEGGLYRSSDNGQSWIPSGEGLTGDGVRVRKLIARGGSLFAATNGGGVYRSDDGGQSWKPSSSGLDERQVFALTVSGSNLFAGTNGRGVYQSTDGGRNWVGASSGLPPGAMVFALTSNATGLYAGLFENGVYRFNLDPARQNWERISEGLSGDSLYVFAFATVGETLYAGTRNGVYRFDPSRQTWSRFSDGLTGDALFILELMTDGTALYAGTRGGIYRLNADKWTPISFDLVNPYILSMAAVGARLFAGTDGKGVSLLAGSAQSWSEANAGLSNKFVNAVTAAGDNLYAGTLGSGAFISNDRGARWTASNAGLPPNANLQSIVVSGTAVWAATFGGGVFRLNDQTARWEAVNDGLANLFVNELFVNGSTIYAGTDGGLFRRIEGAGGWTSIGGIAGRVVSFASDAGVVYAGTDGGGVFRLEAGAASATPVNNGLSNLSVTALGAGAGVLLAGTGNGIFLSHDGGATWTAANNQLPSRLNVYAFVVAGKRVYAGSVYGVFVTDDEGKTWRQINAGLLDVYVTGLAVSGDRLFAATARGGVFRSEAP